MGKFNTQSLHNVSTEDAKNILLAELDAIQPKYLQEILKQICAELDRQEKFIALLKENLRVAEERISKLEENFVADLPGEIWKDIEGCEGKYQISNKGRVKSFYANRVTLLKNYKSEHQAYYRVNLNKKTFNVHRLVALAFIPNPENKPEVNHIDGNKLNNCVENLEWATPSENQRHAVLTGLRKMPRGTASHKAKLTDEQVKFIRQNYKWRDKNFNSIELAKKFNISAREIRDIVAGKYYENIL